MLVCPVSSIPWLIYNLFTLTSHSSGPQLRWLGFDSKHFFFLFSPRFRNMMTKQKYVKMHGFQVRES